MKYPEKIGLVIDPMVPPQVPKKLMTGVFPGNSHFLLHICDPLLLHEQVLIRSDWWTLQFLYSNFACEEIEPLFREGNIKFFAAMNESSNAQPYINADEGAIDKNYLKLLYDHFSALSDTMIVSKASKIVKQIENYSVTKQAINSQSCKIIQDNLFSAFLEKGGKDLPQDKSQPFYHEKGFQNGIGRILDIWSTGTTALCIDPEMQFYIRNFTDTSTEIFKGYFSVEKSVPDVFNSIENVPSLKEHILKEKIEINEFIKIVQSDETRRLREWISKNLSPELDARDCYFAALKKLPSKSNWSNWLRFGVTSSLSIGLGFLLANSPILATLMGLSIGATDLAFGNKFIERFFNDYHPKEWVSYFDENF